MATPRHLQTPDSSHGATDALTGRVSKEGVMRGANRMQKVKEIAVSEGCLPESYGKISRHCKVVIGQSVECL